MEAERIAELFVDGVVVEAEVPWDQTAALHDEELATIARAVERRRNEYSTGRACARRALRRLGWKEIPIVNGDDRAPCWPEGIVGSISHTHGLCAVALAPASVVRSLGLDLEPDAPVETTLFDRICTPEELADLPSDDPGRRVRSIFCAKEAFYKLQYPLTRTFLGFQAVHVALDGEGFIVTLRQDVADLFEAGRRLRGRWRCESGFFAAAMSLPI